MNIDNIIKSQFLLIFIILSKISSSAKIITIKRCENVWSNVSVILRENEAKAKIYQNSTVIVQKLRKWAFLMILNQNLNLKENNNKPLND